MDIVMVGRFYPMQQITPHPADLLRENFSCDTSGPTWWL